MSAYEATIAVTALAADVIATFDSPQQLEALVRAYELPWATFTALTHWEQLSGTTAAGSASTMSLLEAAINAGRTRFREAALAHICWTAGEKAAAPSTAVPQAILQLFDQQTHWRPTRNAHQLATTVPSRILASLVCDAFRCSESSAEDEHAPLVNILPDVVVADTESGAVTFVSVEADMAFISVRAAGLSACGAAAQRRWQGREVRAELWISPGNAFLVKPPLLVPESPAASKAPYVRVSLPPQPLPAPCEQEESSNCFAAYTEALSQARSCARDLARIVAVATDDNVVDATTSALLPWTVALQRAVRDAKTLSEESPLNSTVPRIPLPTLSKVLRTLPLNPSATAAAPVNAVPAPLPSRDAPLFAAVVFPEVVRAGYAAIAPMLDTNADERSESTADAVTDENRAIPVLPRIMMTFTSARGVPVFPYDDEALEVLWKLVPALRAGVAVYDEEQRQELLRLLCEWRAQGRDVGPSGFISEDEHMLTEVLPAQVFTVVEGLRYLHEKEAVESPSSSPSSPMPSLCPFSSPDPPTSANPAARVAAFHDLLARAGAFFFDADRVLARRGVFSLRPVSAVTSKTVLPVKLAPFADAFADSEDGMNVLKEGGEEKQIVKEELKVAFSVTPVPTPLLAYILSTVRASGVDSIEKIAHNLLEAMKRLVSRQ